MPPARAAASSSEPKERAAAFPNAELLLVLLAVVARALHWAGTAVLMNDGPVFLGLAERFARGDYRGALAHDFHPLYPALIALAGPIFGNLEHAAVALSIASGGAIVAIGIALFRAAFNRQVALVAGLLLAIHPIALDQADVQSDPLYTALFLAAVLALWHALADRVPSRAFSAGALAGAAYLVRPEGLGVVVAGAALAVLLERKRAAPLVLALGLGAALVSAPYVAWISLQNGGLVLTQKKSVTRMIGARAADAWLKSGSSELPRDPGFVKLRETHPELEVPPPGVRPFQNAPRATGWRRYPAGLARLAGVTWKSLRPELLVFLGLGLVASRGGSRMRITFFGAFALLYGALLFGLSSHFGYVSRRHVLAHGSLFFGYAGAGIVEAARSLAQVSAPRLSRKVWLRALVAVLAVAALAKGLRPDRTGASAERRAAEWIQHKGMLASNEAVAAVKQRVSYYAGAPFVDLRGAPHEQVLLEYLAGQNTRYLVVDRSEREELLRMIAGQETRLALRHAERDSNGEAYVFELAAP